MSSTLSERIEQLDVSHKPHPDYQFDQAVALIEEPTILDFGAGDGSLSLVLADLFPDSRVVAYEPNAEQVRRASELEDAGIAICHHLTDCYLAIDALEDWDAGRYSTVFTWNVTEHLADVIGEFMGINTLLRPGGVWVGRHHPYYSEDGHHCNGKGVHVKLRHTTLGQHRIPHLLMPEEFAREYGRQVNSMTLNMMTLFQLKAMALRVGFTIDNWMPSVDSAITEPPRPDISLEDARTRSLVFSFRKDRDL